MQRSVRKSDVDNSILISRVTFLLGIRPFAAPVWLSAVSSCRESAPCEIANSRLTSLASSLPCCYYCCCCSSTSPLRSGISSNYSVCVSLCESPDILLLCCLSAICPLSRPFGFTEIAKFPPARNVRPFLKEKESSLVSTIVSLLRSTFILFVTLFYSETLFYFWPFYKYKYIFVSNKILCFLFNPRLTEKVRYSV